MGRYKKLVQTTPVPQSKPLPNREMVRNNAGGYVFKADDFNSLKRFLILGSESGTYYVQAKELTNLNIEVVRRCIEQDGIATVDMIVDVSNRGLAPKNTPAILALALCAIFGDEKTKTHAYDVVPKVCRTATHLFEFLEFRYSDNFGATVGGFGRGLRRALKNWYLAKSQDELVYQLVKYRQREGWTHKDVLRLAHPSPVTSWQSDVFKWVVDGTYTEDSPELIRAYEKAKTTEKATDIANLIYHYNLPREAIPTQFLKDKVVWQALLERMPITAMLRNLGNMSKAGLLTPLSDSEKKVVNAFNREAIHRGRVHPMSILLAMKTYASGRSFRGDGAWPVNQTIVDTLDQAFYESFERVEPTGLRYMVALDVSGSMGVDVAGMNMTASEVAAAFALYFKRVEKTAFVFGFSTEFRDLGISSTMRLNDVMSKTRGLTFGRTDCALPMVYADKHNIPVDVFIIITDNETWAGNIHPTKALEQYRANMNMPDAKLIVLATSSNGFSIADPEDKGMLDIVGFSADVPSVVDAFVRGM